MQSRNLFKSDHDSLERAIMKRFLNNKGFTLIELLVVIAIIGILASIAISQYNAYKDTSLNATALSDLRNGVTAQEAYYVDNNTYVSCATATDCETILPEFRPSKDETATPVVTPFTFAAGAETFTGTAQHRSGSIEYQYDSSGGVFTEN